MGQLVQRNHFHGLVLAPRDDKTTVVRPAAAIDRLTVQIPILFVQNEWAVELLVSVWGLKNFNFGACGHKKEASVRAKFKSSHFVSEVEMRQNNLNAQINYQAKSIDVDRD